MSDYCPLLEDFVVPLTACLNVSVTELNNAANLVVSIVSSILRHFEAHSSHRFVQDLIPHVYECLELSMQYRGACINVAEIGARESTILMLKDQLKKGVVVQLRQYVNDVRGALLLCDFCLKEFERAFQSTKHEIKDRADSTQKRIEVSRAGIKNSSIATGVGGAVAIAAIAFGIPLAFISPPVGVPVLLAGGAAGAATFTGGAVGLGVHGLKMKEHKEVMQQLQELDGYLNRSKIVIDELECSISSIHDGINHMDQHRGQAERRDKLPPHIKKQIEYFLDQTITICVQQAHSNEY